MTDQKLFISKKPNSHLIILMKVFIHGRFFFFFFLKTSSRHCIISLIIKNTGSVQGAM